VKGSCEHSTESSGKFIAAEVAASQEGFSSMELVALRCVVSMKWKSTECVL
jgi:hypothetical protein